MSTYLFESGRQTQQSPDSKCPVRGRRWAWSGPGHPGLAGPRTGCKAGPGRGAELPGRRGVAWARPGPTRRGQRAARLRPRPPRRPFGHLRGGAGRPRFAGQGGPRRVPKRAAAPDSGRAERERGLPRSPSRLPGTLAGRGKRTDPERDARARHWVAWGQRPSGLPFVLGPPDGRWCQGPCPTLGSRQASLGTGPEGPAAAGLLGFRSARAVWPLRPTPEYRTLPRGDPWGGKLVKHCR